MRHSIFIALSFSALIFILYHFGINSPPHAQPESFISPNIICYAKQYNLKKKITDFYQEPLWEKLKTINFPLIADELQVSPERQKKIRTIIQQSKNALNNPVLMNLLGKEVSIALYPLKKQTSKQDLLTSIQNSIVLFARPRYKTKIIEHLIHKFQADHKVSQNDYGKYSIVRIPLDRHKRLSVVNVRDLVIISFNEHLLRKSLDIFDKEAPSIIDDSHFRKNFQLFTDSNLFFYLDIVKLRFIMQSLLFKSQPDEPFFFFSNLDKQYGYQSLYWGVTEKKSALFGKTFISFNTGEAHSATPAKPKAIRADSLKKIRDDTIFYYWTNIFFLNHLAAYMPPETTKTGKNNTISTRFSQATGFTPREFLSFFTGTISIAATDIPKNQFVPVPRCMLILKMKNTAKVKKALQNIVDNYALPITDQHINGTVVHLWGDVIAIDDLQPAYTIIGDNLLVASNKKQISEFLQIPRKKKLLFQSPAFKRVDYGLTGKNNSMMYLNFAVASGVLKEMCSWLGTMIAIEDRNIAHKSKLLIDQLINPLLDGLSMYAEIGMRSNLQNDGILINTTTRFDTGKKKNGQTHRRIENSPSF